MKKLLILPLILALTACNTTSPTPSPAPTPAPTPGTVTITPIELGLIQTGTTVATGAVLNFAVSQPSTRTRLANEIYASASALYQASGGTPLTPDAFTSLVTSYGQAGDAQYASYVTALSALYKTYYTKYVTNGSTATQNFAAILNSFAQGAELGASTYATITPTPPPAAGA